MAKHINLLEKYKDQIDGFVIDKNITDVDSSAYKYLHSHYKKEIFWGGVISAFYVAGVLYLLFSDGGLEDPRGLFALFVPIVIYFGFFASIKTKMLREFYKQFAQTNGFNYNLKGDPETEAGAIFSVGHKKEIYDSITGNLNGLPISLFNYYYTVGSGKNSRTFNLTVWSIDFKNPVPPMLLLVDQHYFGDKLTDSNLNNANQVSLPAKIEKHFTLFSEKKFEIEALQIFTPDFLESIYDKYRRFSLDFVGTKLYVYSAGIIKNKVGLELLKEFITVFAKRLEQKLPAMGGSIKALNEAITKTEPISPLGKAGDEIARAFQNPKVSNSLVWGLFTIFILMFALTIITAFIKT